MIVGYFIASPTQRSILYDNYACNRSPLFSIMTTFLEGKTRNHRFRCAVDFNPFRGMSFFSDLFIELFPTSSFFLT